MRIALTRPPGQFCWLDLAAADSDRARDFYGSLFGWNAQEQRIGKGAFARFLSGGTEIASFYQLSGRHLAQGVPSHWTPYVSVTNADRTASQAAALGAAVVVEPFDVPGIARIALVQDPVGAAFGVWQAAEPALDLP
jgi:predicted enzyme related to lactoylglutathione lyase